MTPWGLLGDSQAVLDFGPEMLQNESFSRVWGGSRGKAGIRDANELLLGPEEDDRGGVLSLRTSECKTPVLGDSVVKDPGHQSLGIKW